MSFLKEYGLPIIIIIILLTLLPPIISPFLGGVMGSYTTYVVTALVLFISLWLNKKTQQSDIVK